MELKIDRGLKSYEVKDLDDTLLGTIYVNPADFGIAARLEEARRAIQQLADGLASDADADVDKIIEADKLIKEQVNYIFGSDASSVFFKGVSALALLPDGSMVFEKVLQAAVPIIEDAVGKAIKASQMRVQKHAGAYTNTAKGLAPGQKV
jgi:hypothetical protein